MDGNGARGTRGVTRLDRVERFGRLDLSAYRRVIALAPRRRCRWPGRRPGDGGTRRPPHERPAVRESSLRIMSWTMVPGQTDLS